MTHSLKSKSRLIIYALLTAVLLLTTACNGSSHATNGGKGNIPPDQSNLTRFTDDQDKIAIFTTIPQGFWARNDGGNGSPFNCSFKRSNAVIDGGLLTLTLNQNGHNYAGAEYRTHQRYSYGYYSVSMKPAKCAGVISSFFTYTGWPWDEIDIEFLGNDTTRVQFNYFKNGKGGHEYYYELGFDASKDFHEYGFDWKPDSITWYVDGKPVYRVTTAIPAADGHIMMNLWNVEDGNNDWAGRFTPENLPVSAEYQWIGYKSA